MFDGVLLGFQIIRTDNIINFIFCARNQIENIY